MYMTEVHRLLSELLRDEVFPAIERYNAAVDSPRCFVNDGEALNMMANACIAVGTTGAVSSCIWTFNDHMQHRQMSVRASNVVGALGVSKDMFWCLLLAYAMYDGLRDYKVHHGGNLPDDDAAYLYAILTADDLAEEVKKDF